MKILKWIGWEIVISNFLRKLRFQAEFHQERIITWKAVEDGMTDNTREIKVTTE